MLTISFVCSTITQKKRENLNVTIKHTSINTSATDAKSRDGSLVQTKNVKLDERQISIFLLYFQLNLQHPSREIQVYVKYDRSVRLDEYVDLWSVSYWDIFHSVCDNVGKSCTIHADSLWKTNDQWTDFNICQLMV